MFLIIFKILTCYRTNEDIEILRFFELGIPIKMIHLKGNTKAVDIPEDILKVEKHIVNDPFWKRYNNFDNCP